MTDDELTDEQIALADIMSGISEDKWSAGWVTGLEFDLWEMVIGKKDPSYGMGGSFLLDLVGLRAMAERCGGWIVWDREHGERFVPMAEWLAIYDEHVGRR